MARTTPPLLPKIQRLVSGVGTNIRTARLRRRYAASVVADRAGIDRRTLGRVERGDASVSIGIYARVLQALGLVDDLASIAKDDELGRRMQDLKLTTPRRAPRVRNDDEESEG